MTNCVVSLREQVMFDTSKKEMLNPNQGHKKIVGKLKSRYKVRQIQLGAILNAKMANILI